ncbi:hypothetical protein [Castellaniella sp. UC4442_H9]
MSDLALALVMLSCVGAGYILGHVHALLFEERRRWRAARGKKHG